MPGVVFYMVVLEVFLPCHVTITLQILHRHVTCHVTHFWVIPGRLFGNVGQDRQILFLYLMNRKFINMLIAVVFVLARIN